MSRLIVTGVFLLSTLSALDAQSNERPGTDVLIGDLYGIRSKGREGSFPNGQNGLVVPRTLCNSGLVDVPCLAPMHDDHFMTSFLLMRESEGRFEQISDYSFVFHHYFITNGSLCTPCENPGDGAFLGVGCSDVHGSGIWGDPFWLGPPQEIDPWLGLWEPICSHFDRGEPPVQPPADCDGQRSPIDPPGLIGHQVRVLDADLDVVGARFFAQVHEIVRGEKESLRFDNLASREFVPSWTGSGWLFQIPPTSTNPIVFDSVLHQWEGAVVNSKSNGTDDGRIYVAVKVLDLGSGFYRYDYAIHNRDNRRGAGALRIPACLEMQVRNLYVNDIDDDPANDWEFSRSDDEIVFSTDSNPLRWNSVYNISFEVDAPPRLESSVLIDAFDPGPGDPQIEIESVAPSKPLRLAVVPRQAQPGDGIEFRATHGAPGEPVLLAVSAVDGRPTFLNVVLDVFGPEGTWSLTSSVPGGLSGLIVDFRALGISECHRVVETKAESVTFL